MLEVAAVHQVLEHRQERVAVVELFVSVRQQQRQEPQAEPEELVRGVCGDSTLMILQELKCK